MHKKLSFASFIVSIALVSMFLFGCAATGMPAGVKLDKSNPTTLEIWHYYNGPQQNTFDEMIVEFNSTIGQEKGIIVEAFSQGSVNELLEKVVASAKQEVRAKDIPDIFAAYADTAYEVDQLGLVASLDPYFTDEELSQYVPSYIEEGRFDSEDSLKIFPTAKSTEIFLMDKTSWDVFANETGASYADLETVEGVTATAKKYYDWSDDKTPEPNDGKAFFGRDAVANYIISSMKQQGIDIINFENGQTIFNTDEAAMRKIWDNYYIPFINGHFTALGKFRSDDVKTGDLIAFVGSTSGSAYFPTEVTLANDTSYNIEHVALPVPIFEGGDRYIIQQGAGMVVTKADPTKEYAAAEFLKWFTDTQNNLKFTIQVGYLPVKIEANNSDFIQKQFETSSTNTAQAMKDTVLVAIDEVTNNTLYTSKTIHNGFNARKVLEYSLSDKAIADRKEVLALIEQGLTQDEAVAKLATDENFIAWLDKLKFDLSQTQS